MKIYIMNKNADNDLYRTLISMILKKLRDKELFSSTFFNYDIVYREPDFMCIKCDITGIRITYCSTKSEDYIIYLLKGNYGSKTEVIFINNYELASMLINILYNDMLSEYY